VKISSLFQISERTIASTETNNTSTESSDTQLFGAGKSKGVALLRGLHAHLPQKDIEKRVNLTKPSQDAKKKKIMIATSLFLYYELSVCPLILNSNKVYFLSSLITKPNLGVIFFRWYKKFCFPNINAGNIKL
jgi:hypothetical protein